MRFVLIVIVVWSFSMSVFSQYANVNLNRVNRYDGQNRKTGVWISITPENCNLIIQKYKKGKMDGFFLMYFNNGTLAKEGAFKNDKEHGKWNYYINGVLVSQTYYKEGIKIRHAHINPRHPEKLFD